jgi:hypothetical protein
MKGRVLAALKALSLDNCRSALARKGSPVFDSTVWRGGS